VEFELNYSNDEKTKLKRPRIYNAKETEKDQKVPQQLSKKIKKLETTRAIVFNLEKLGKIVTQREKRKKAA